MLSQGGCQIAGRKVENPHRTVSGGGPVAHPQRLDQRTMETDGFAPGSQALEGMGNGWPGLLRRLGRLVEVGA